ncbi:hypothetical protein [Mesorhizobium sp. CN2-181]|uniref:hypothetical protein n=1 Tax=Mesorhizobium yinganensis TaxID=3157707 RepID=UPI0032B7A619
MTDIPGIAPIVIRRPDLQRLKIPMLKIGASLAAMFGLLGDAINMAYVEPYTIHRRRPQVASDDDLDGRDPDW